MGDLRDRLSAAGPARIGGIATVIWVLLLVLAWIFGANDAGLGLAGWAGIITPFVLIWLAVWFAQALDALRHEAQALRAQLELLSAAHRDELGSDTGPVQPARAAPPAELAEQGHESGAAAKGSARASPQAVHHSAGLRPADRRPADAHPADSRPSDARQGLLGLDQPQPAQVSSHELVAALNFPDGPDDHYTIAALRKVLADQDTARLIRAAQDVITLMATRGIYMDDSPPRHPDAALWRRFAAGARGPVVQGLSLDTSPQTLDTAAGMLRHDEVFRDAAHHFLRHFDRLILRAAQDFDDDLLAALAETRSGRAFTMLAQVTGIIGTRIEPETQP